MRTDANAHALSLSHTQAWGQGGGGGEVLLMRRLLAARGSNAPLTADEQALVAHLMSARWEPLC